MRSNVPLTGLTIKPANPLPTPLKKPPIPLFFDSLYGYFTTPTTPEPIAQPKSIIPLPAPSMMFLGASRTFSSSLHSMYLLSPETTSNPLDKDPKMLEAEPNVP